MSCKLVLPTSEFNRGKNTCKQCQAMAWSEWRKTERGTKKILLGSARRRAKLQGVEFAITAKDISIPDTCPALHIPIMAGDGTRRENSPSIDRIDYTKGYVPGNVVVVSELANRLKSNASSGQLREVADWMESVGQ